MLSHYLTPEVLASLATPSQLVHEIGWLKNKIHEMRADEKRRGPSRRSHAAQIEQYQYQIRHKELTLVFGE